MPRGQEVDWEPLLFPIGDLGPPEGPEATPAACVGAYGDNQGADRFQLALAGLAALFVKVHVNAQLASMDTMDE